MSMHELSKYPNAEIMKISISGCQCPAMQHGTVFNINNTSLHPCAQLLAVLPPL